MVTTTAAFANVPRDGFLNDYPLCGIKLMINLIGAPKGWNRTITMCVTTVGS